ncbi:Uncharacterised protein [Mycobacteroides abscessus subsp. abscessus]|nr:Uncharacterised protein [Mycobacteroides abscessus subsp. abscessus]
MTAQHDLLLGQWEPFTRGDKDLPLHQVDAGHHLGYRMLHLEPGIHLHEVVRLGCIAIEDEFDRAGAEISHTARDLTRCLAHSGAQLWGQQRRRSLFDDLLMPALQAALALAQVHHVAVGVAEYLNLDMPGASKIALHQQGVIAEEGGSLAPRCDQCVRNSAQVVYHPHALTATARGGFDDQRDPDFLRGENQLGIGERSDAAGHHGFAGRGHRVLGPDLVAHGVHGFGRRPHEDNPRGLTRTDEICILRNESIPRVNSLCPGLLGSADDGIDVEITRGIGAEAHGGIAGPQVIGVAVGIHSDGTNPHGPQCRRDADRDLAAVCD